MPPPTKDNPIFTSLVPLWGVAILLACAFLCRCCEKMAGA
jgi:hypothetical protein